MLECASATTLAIARYTTMLPATEWTRRATPAGQERIALTNGAPSGCRRVKDLGGVKERSDAMMAIYPGGGARFARHIDNTAGDGRRLTVLCYLNPDWEPSQGGALRLWPPDGSNPVDVYPFCGRLALFYSKTVPHGVQRTMSVRHSVTLWCGQPTPCIPASARQCLLDTYSLFGASILKKRTKDR